MEIGNLYDKKHGGFFIITSSGNAPIPLAVPQSPQSSMCHKRRLIHGRWPGTGVVHCRKGPFLFLVEPRLCLQLLVCLCFALFLLPSISGLVCPHCLQERYGSTVGSIAFSLCIFPPIRAYRFEFILASFYLSLSRSPLSLK